MTGVERLWLGNHNLLSGSTAALSGRAEPFPRPLLEAGRDDAISAGPTPSGRDEPFPVPLPPTRLEGTHPFPGQLLEAGRGEPFPRPLPPKRLEGTIPFPKPLITQLDVSKRLYPGSTTIKSSATRSLARFRVCGIRMMLGLAQLDILGYFPTPPVDLVVDRRPCRGQELQLASSSLSTAANR